MTTKSYAEFLLNICAKITVLIEILSISLILETLGGRRGTILELFSHNDLVNA